MYTIYTHTLAFVELDQNVGMVARNGLVAVDHDVHVDALASTHFIAPIAQQV